MFRVQHTARGALLASSKSCEGCAARAAARLTDLPSGCADRPRCRVEKQHVKLVKLAGKTFNLLVGGFRQHVCVRALCLRVRRVRLQRVSAAVSGTGEDRWEGVYTANTFTHNSKHNTHL